MRAGLIIIGIILLAAGIWVVAGHAFYQDTDTLVQVGSAKITATHDKGVPQWIGIAGIVVGGLLAIGGFMRRVIRRPGTPKPPLPRRFCLWPLQWVQWMSRT